MAIKDLLWACPICHQVETIAPDGRCRGCDTCFSRGRGAAIRARTAREVLELDPVAWLERLPWPDLDGEGRSLPAELQPPFQQRAACRTANTDLPLRRGSDLLGYVERFGPPVNGKLTLSHDAIQFAPESRKSGEEQGSGWRWQLASVTAIQPASSSIQLKARKAPAVSLTFPEGSLRLWEQRLQYGVRRAYQAAGKGDVVEFQPRIRCR